jgi:hypothetical protein
MNTLKKVFISAVAAFGLFAQVRTANATSIGAWFGKPTDSSTLSCWVQRTSHTPSQPASLQNVCGGAPPSWDMPLLVQNSGHTVTIAFSDAANVTCTLFGLNQTGGVFTQQTVSGVSQGVLSMNATVPNSGSLLLRCTPSQGAGLHSINYNM